MRRPCLVMGFAAAIATFIALLIPLWASVVLAALAVFSCFVGRGRRLFWRLAALTAALLLLTTVVYRLWVVEPLSVLDNQQDTVTGQVVALPTGGRMVTVEVTAAQKVPPGTQMALFLPEEMTPQRWDTITAQVTLTSVPLSGYQPARGVYLYALPVACDDQHVQISSGRPPLTARWSNHLLSGLYQALPEQEGDLLAALCLGRKEALSPALEEAFHGSGLAHLLVVSGLHLSLVVLAMRLFLRRIGTGYRLSAMLTMPAMVLFMVLVGASPSIMRAGLMCLCWLVGLLCRRRSEGLNSLGLATVVLLLLNPYQLYSASFQLSFLATAGVLCLTPRLCGWLYRRPMATTRLGRLGQQCFFFTYSAVAVCLRAPLLTLPVLCFYFGGFTATTILANLLAVVPAGWVLLLGWVGILCCAVPFLGWLGQPILWLAGVGGRYLTHVARWCDFSWAWVSVTTWWQWLLLTALCLLLIYTLLGRLSLRRALPPLLVLAVLALPLGHLLATPATTLSVQDGEAGVAVLLEQGEHTALLLTDSHELDDALYLLEERHCTRLDWVIIAKGAPMDAGLLADLYRQTGAPQVVTTDREDWFAGVTFSVGRIPYAKPLTLWDGCTLTPTTKTWWRLDCGANPVQVGGDPAIPCPTPEGLAVYAGLPSRVHTPAVVACDPEDLVGQPLDWAQDAHILTDECVTFTVRPGGEWSVLPWQ